MDIYSIFMVLSILLFIFIFNNNDKIEVIDKKTKRYCTILGILLFLIAALRSQSVGIDSGQYSWHFYQIREMSFNNIISVYEDELGFYFLLKLLTFISKDPQIMFVVIGGIYAYTISRFIYKYSKNPMVSFIMLIPMMYFAFSLTGLRQTVAISILLVSIDYIISKRFIKFFILLLISSLFHKSAILFFPAYFINFKKITFNKIILYIGIAPVVFFLRPFIIKAIQIFLYSGYYIDVSQSAGGWTTLFIYILIVSVALIFKSKSEIEDNNLPLFFSMMYIGMLIQMFVPLQPNIFRVSMYYNISSIILIPEILKTQKDRLSKFLGYSIFFIAMSIEYYFFTFYAAGANPYKFFWQ